jgi:DNA polymerase
MTTLHLDCETRSTVDLKKAGVYVYAQDPTTDVWCVAWAFDDEEVAVWTPGMPVPHRISEHIRSGGILTAHNAAFERIILACILYARYGWPKPKTEQWRCTMAMAYAMALPGSLENMGAALGSNVQKDMGGRRLMLAMSKPRRPKKGEPEGLAWRNDPDDIAKLHAYCVNDVEAERTSDKRLVRLRASEQRMWHLDQTINDRGVFVDVDIAKRALALVEHQEAKLDKEMAHATEYEVSACSNLNQIKVWLKNHGVELGQKLDKKTMTYVDTLDKAFVEELLAGDLDPDVRRVLELRQEAGQASVAKINALLNGTSPDGRARGLLQYHAASTGRWAGRRFQPQNLKRPGKGFDCNAAIDVVLRYPTQKAADLLDAMFDAPMSCLSYILRGLIKAPKGKKIVAADYKNIEGRVLAWLAGQSDKLAAFRAYDEGRGPDLYLVAAAGIYGVPVSALNDESPERQVGKVAELACGYGGGVGAFQTMASTYGVKVPDDQAEEIKTAWRDANERIVRFWWDLEQAGLRAIGNPGQAVSCGSVAFKVNGSFLWLRLPSGRALSYPYPAIRTVRTPWDSEKEAITFKAVPNVSNVRKIVSDPSNTSRWSRISTYGGSLAENVTQAVARDLLAEAMVRLEENGYPVILTVHDENVSEVDASFGSVSEYEDLMSELPAWASGLPVVASGFESERYRK